jgi:hypothetical protein
MALRRTRSKAIKGLDRGSLKPRTGPDTIGVRPGARSSGPISPVAIVGAVCAVAVVAGLYFLLA